MTQYIEVTEDFGRRLTETAVRGLPVLDAYFTAMPSKNIEHDRWCAKQAHTAAQVAAAAVRNRQAENNARALQLRVARLQAAESQPALPPATP